MDGVRITLRAARVNADLTLTEAAELIGVTRTTLSNWERGKTEPKSSQIEKMSQVYQMPAAIFFVNRVQSN